MTRTAASVRSKGRAMATPDFDEGLVERLSPAPAFAFAYPSSSAPIPNAGITPQSTAALRCLLIKNHKSFHASPNHKGFHNRLSHRLFATYGIGAPGHSPGPITHENWTKHLGNEDFYNAYMSFFSEEIQTHQLPQTLEKFVFSNGENWTKDGPGMLDRFMSAVIHPLIHLGDAAEFGVEGMAVEGLAQTAVHDVDHENLCNPNYINPQSSAGGYLPALDSGPSLITPNTKPQHTHAFTILARILEDDRPEAGKTCTKDSTAKFIDTLNSAGASFSSIHPSGKSARMEKRYKSDRKIWPGWRFDVVHLFTSNLFIPSILSLLKPAYKEDLLRAYFLVLLGYFVCHGRPALDIKGFFSVTADPKPDHSSSLTDLSARVGNPWYTLLAEIIPHRDEHHIKTERTLAHCAALYGTRPKGHFSHTGLKGSKEIDGTLFVRTGGLLMDVLQWTPSPGGMGDQDYGEQALWSKSGLGWD
ncbi:hypothetical protein RHS03_09879, partial [Rhizoctonia solani]